MSFMKTLAKVAIGVAVAKGASAVMKSRGSGASTSAGGLGGLLGGLTGSLGTGQRIAGAPSPASSTAGLESMLGGLLGGGAAGGVTGAGGLGGLLENITGATGGGNSGLGGMLGGLAAAGGAGGLFASARQSMRRRPAEDSASFGAVLNSQFDATPEPAIEPSQGQEATAALMLAAMIQAAKSDGTFDEAERSKLLEQLGDVDAEEADFVHAQLRAPVDVEALVADTPPGMGPQIYAMSLLGIDFDTQQEAQYLHKLALAYAMTPQQVNSIHAEMGVPSLYT